MRTLIKPSALESRAKIRELLCNCAGEFVHRILYGDQCKHQEKKEMVLKIYHNLRESGGCEHI